MVIRMNALALLMVVFLCSSVAFASDIEDVAGNWCTGSTSGNSGIKEGCPILLTLEIKGDKLNGEDSHTDEGNKIVKTTYKNIKLYRDKKAVLTMTGVWNQTGASVKYNGTFSVTFNNAITTFEGTWEDSPPLSGRGKYWGVDATMFGSCPAEGQKCLPHNN